MLNLFFPDNGKKHQVFFARICDCKGRAFRAENAHALAEMFFCTVAALRALTGNYKTCLACAVLYVASDGASRRKPAVYNFALRCHHHFSEYRAVAIVHVLDFSFCNFVKINYHLSIVRYASF